MKALWVLISRPILDLCNFLKANFTTRNKKEVVRNLDIVSLRQFWVNNVWTLRGQASPLKNKKGLTFVSWRLVWNLGFPKFLEEKSIKFCVRVPIKSSLRRILLNFQLGAHCLLPRKLISNPFLIENLQAEREGVKSARLLNLYLWLESWDSSTLKIEPLWQWVLNGGFNFILFLEFNRNQTENDRYWQKNNFFQYGYQNNAEFYADFKFVDASF